MDHREELSALIREKDLLAWEKSYFYPNIPGTIKEKATMYFDPNINTDSIVAAIDETLRHNFKNGLIFTTTGIYYRGLMEKTFYFNYSDVQEVQVFSDKKGRNNSSDAKLYLFLEEHQLIEISGTYYKATLKELIDELVQLTGQWDDIINHRETGRIEKYGLTEKQLKKCHAIIHAASAAAGAPALAMSQIPLSDSAVITPIQIGMITSLGAVFEMRVTESMAKGILASVAATIAGRSISQLFLGWIPGFGNALNSATAVSITEVIGWYAVKHFTKIKASDRAKHRVDGMRAGYEAASDEYEAKFRRQAEEFLKQTQITAEQFAEYEQLIRDLEDYIAKHSGEDITDIKEQYDKLTKLPIAFLEA